MPREDGLLYCYVHVRYNLLFQHCIVGVETDCIWSHLDDLLICIERDQDYKPFPNHRVTFKDIQEMDPVPSAKSSCRFTFLYNDTASLERAESRERERADGTGGGGFRGLEGEFRG